MIRDLDRCCRRRVASRRWFALLLAAVCGIGILSAGYGQAEERSDGKVRVIFGGDVMLDGGPGHAIANGIDPFGHVASLLADAELAVCNLECAVAKEGDRFEKSYNFQARPEAIPILKRHFAAVCLANNHSGDYGRRGFLKELASLDKAELPYFGGGRNAEAARRPLILERNGLRVAFLGYNDYPPEEFEAGDTTPGTAWLRKADIVADLKAARERDGADFVIPFLHWGNEMEPAPEVSQKRLAHALVDAGADAVIGGHAHVTQTVDVYRGRPIVYSLGNFVFDYFPEDPPVWTGWIVRLTFSKTAPVELETLAVTLDSAGIPRLTPHEKAGDR
jgi:poly-gamma-glutamate synthesis protein (capsule biosynthesis protein)